jgi:hypothetical protein
VIGDGDKFSGMRERLFGKVNATQHPRNFLNAACLIQCRYGCTGFAGPALFVHKQVLMSLGGNLGQVGDGQHLTVFAQLAQ